MNEELKKYFNILCNNDYPKFIDKYLETNSLKRLTKIGQFCGCDYNKLWNIRFWYTVLDHSLSTALITYNFTKDKKSTLAALFHDLGTPVTNHCVDFYLNDSKRQESSEKSIEKIIEEDEGLLKLLINDNINLKDIINADNYSIAENKSPKLCADRLDGVLHSAFIWLNRYSLIEIENVYKNITVLNNEENHLELGFNDKLSAEGFYKMVYDYAVALQSNEDQFTMRFIADAIKYLIDNNIIIFQDLYIMSEKEIINLFKKHISNWSEFENLKILNKSNDFFEGAYKRLDVKKRIVNPLCMQEGSALRVDEVSKYVREKQRKYLEYTDSLYYNL